MTEPIRYSADDAPSRHLAAADPALGKLIARIGGLEFTPPADLTRFAALVRGVTGQQLSGAAATRIFERLRISPGLTPEALANATDEELLGAGLSRR